MKKIISILCTWTVSSVAPISVISCITNNKVSNQDTNETNFQQYKDEMEDNLVLDDLETKGIDGSNLSTNNTSQDAMDLVYEKILLDDPEIESIKLINKNKADFLIEGTNTLKVEYDSHSNKKMINAHINNVKLIENKNINISRNVSERLIRDRFFKSITSENLYGWNTIFDALTYFQNEAKKIDPKAHVKFTNKYILSRIGRKNFEAFQNATINLPINQSNKIFSELLTYFKPSRPIPTGEIISTAVAIGLLACGASGASVIGLATTIAVGTYAVTMYLMKLFGDFKRVQEAFLTNESEQFDLEVYYDDNWNANTETFEVIGTLKGIKLRSREVSREIIEKETYVFNHQVTIKEALIDIEQHIRATMFPTTLDFKSKHQFTLRAILKNSNIASNKIIKGLNMIETVLKPQLTGGISNIFKRIFNTDNIDVTIRIKYQPK